MNNSINYYKFNNSVDLLVNTTYQEASKYLNKEYHHHQFSTIDPFLGHVIYNFTKCKSIFDRPADDFSLHIHKFFSSGWYRINISDNEIMIDVYGNNMEISMSQHMLVHPSLRICHLSMIP